MTGATNTASTLDGPPANSWRRAIGRLFVAGWLGLTVAGGLSQTFVPGLLDPNGGLAAVFPHLRWGHVMFNRIPRRLRLVRYRRPGERELRPLAEVVETSSLGYADARAAMSALGGAAELARLCAFTPRLDGLELVTEEYDVGARADVVADRSVCCREGRLNDCLDRVPISGL
jgi:hypothetical protein